jgi:hypothetical protein
VAAAVVAVVPALALAVPATAATTGSNVGTLTLTPPAVRSVTVTPATSTFANCTGPNAAQLAFPNGFCSVGVAGNSGAAGGVTVTNGTAAGHIDVNGANAVPSDSGTPWTLLDSPSAYAPSLTTPAADQYDELTQVLFSGHGVVNSVVSTTPTCDLAFDGTTSTPGGCTAAAGASTTESLVIEGPSTSTDAGPFAITTTWTAVP